VLLAAIAKVGVRSITLPNLCYCYVDGALLWRLLLNTLALIEDGKFILVYGYTWKLSCSVMIFHHVLVLLLNYNYNCNW